VKSKKVTGKRQEVKKSKAVILSPSPAVILSEVKDLGGLRINASEGSRFRLAFFFFGGKVSLFSKRLDVRS